MKKNFMMRIAAVLLVLVLLTTCVISGTFAKYVTSDQGEDEARIAKWGVIVTLDDFDMFDANYNNTVISANGTDKVVAPGTTGTLAGISITGAPEVKVEVKFEATLTLTGWEVAGAEYCPLEITVGSTTYKIGTNATDIADLIDKVETAIEGYTAEYDANVNLATSAETPQVSWTWAFEGNDDVKDTALGDTAANATAPTISLQIVTTVTQID